MVSAGLAMLHPRLREAIRELGYQSLLPVQEKSIPAVLSGAHTLIVAPTGSGKTEAALLPVLSLMLECRDKDGCKERGVKLIYITPLRALNRDIETRIEKLVASTGFSVMVRHGDTTPKGRRAFLKETPDVMITTPESLNLMLTVRNASKIWRSVRWVIVDEIHEFIDSERGSELAVILERLQELSNHRIQRIGLSATLSDKTIRNAAVRLLAGRRRVEVVKDPSPKEYSIRLEVVEEGDSFWSEAAKRIAEIAGSVKGKVLVFVNTRGTAEKLAAEISKNADYEVVVHHGSLSRVVREEAEKSFKHGSAKVLVATSSMELGIDIGEIELVIQFLSPRSIITMAQRAGRAGHRFGEVSKAVIVTSNNIFEMLESAIIAYRAMKGHLEDQRIHVNPLDALAHQIVGMVLERKTARSEQLYNIVTRAAPFLYLPREDYDEVVEHLDGVRVLKIREEDELGPGGRAFKYFYHVSMIPDERNYTVYDIVSGSKIGELSERFVESRLMQQKKNDKFAFILAGQIWEALDIDPEKGRIDAKPLGAVTGYVPSWEGELIPVDYKVAREACSLISLCMIEEECTRLLKVRGIREDLAQRIARIAHETSKLWGAQITPLTPVIESFRGGTALHVCLGSKGNFALGLLLSKILQRYSLDTMFDHIPYAIIFRNPMGVRPGLVAKALRDASKMDYHQRYGLIEEAVKGSIAYLLRFVHVAKRMGVVDPDKSLPRELVKRIISAYRGSIVERETVREMLYDKVDFDALNTFLDNMREPIIVEPRGGPSPLLQEVLSNPYLRKDKALDIKSIALSTLINSFRKRLRQRSVILLCTTCGKWWRRTAADVKGEIACPKCGSRMIAVLPDTEWGREALAIFQEGKKGKRLRGEKAKIYKEVMERAKLFVAAYREGMIEKAVEALSAHGVGPTRARRLLSTLVVMGEDAFYKELFRAMEEYASYKKFWDSERKRQKTVN